MSFWGQIFFQDANSPIMENMILFYDHVTLVVIIIMAMISYILFKMFLLSNINRFMFHGQMIEIIWTIIPMMFLIFIAIPSLKILYMTDDMKNPIISIKVLGHQWYWSYEYSDFKSISFDSFMINWSKNFDFRLLDVDNRMVLPNNVQIRFLISSMDVIHSFTIPVLGMKVDAVPGRINQISMFINRPGIYFGQCSEICGANHSFMPIVLEVNFLEFFLDWINEF